MNPADKNTAHITSESPDESRVSFNFDDDMNIHSETLELLKHSSNSDALYLLENLNRIPSSKFEWSSFLHRKGVVAGSSSNDNMGWSRVVVLYTAFILPDDNGVVIQRKDEQQFDQNPADIWLHLTGDGMKVGFGKLEQSPKPRGRENHRNDSAVNEKIELKATNSINNQEKDFSRLSLEWLVDEAYARAPASCIPFKPRKKALIKSNDISGINNTNSKFYVGYPFLSVSSTISKKNPYVPIAALLHPKRKQFFRLYLKLQKFIEHVKRSIPKITLHLFCTESTLDLTKSEPTVKVMLMDNGPLPDIHAIFDDGLTFIYAMKAGKITIKLPGVEGLSTELDVSCDSYQHSKEIDVSSQEENSLKQCYMWHIATLQAATEECLAIECTMEGCEATANINDDIIGQSRYSDSKTFGDSFPVTKIMLSRGLDRKEWKEIKKASKDLKLHESIESSFVDKVPSVQKEILDVNFDQKKIDSPTLSHMSINADTVSLNHCLFDSGSEASFQSL